MLVLDTHAFIFEALDRGRLSRRVRFRIDRAAASGSLTVSDITLWEVAMLAARGRLDVGAPTDEFLDAALVARSVRTLPITPLIASMSARMGIHADPADRIIAATAMAYDATLVTRDSCLRDLDHLKTMW